MQKGVFKGERKKANVDKPSKGNLGWLQGGMDKGSDYAEHTVTSHPIGTVTEINWPLTD